MRRSLKMSVAIPPQVVLYAAPPTYHHSQSQGQDPWGFRVMCTSANGRMRIIWTGSWQLHLLLLWRWDHLPLSDTHIHTWTLLLPFQWPAGLISTDHEGTQMNIVEVILLEMSHFIPSRLTVRNPHAEDIVTCLGDSRLGRFFVPMGEFFFPWFLCSQSAFCEIINLSFLLPKDFFQHEKPLSLQSKMIQQTA